MAGATFTEQETKQLAEFINYVATNAEFPNCKKPLEARKVTAMLNHMAAHLRKCESFMFEPKPAEEMKDERKRE